MTKESIKLLPGKWAWEPKINGWRALIHVPTLTVFNRHGELLSITHEFPVLEKEFWKLDYLFGVEWLDCEMLGRRHPLKKGTIVILDVVADLPYRKRREFVERFMDLDPDIQLEGIESFSGNAPSDPLTLWEQLQEENHRYGCDYYEGLVAKRVTSGYETQLVSPSKTTPNWVKYRFDQYTER